MMTRTLWLVCAFLLAGCETDEVRSPLLQSVSSGEDTTAFWEVIQEKGAPLVEDHPEDSNQVLISFLWRGTEGVENVVVFSAISGWTLPQNRLNRIAGTDVWYQTYEGRADVRFGYRFSVNDNLRSIWDDPDWTERAAAFKPDPFNANSYRAAGSTYSIGYGPKAERSPWPQVQPGVPQGRMEEVTVDSPAMGGPRKVLVHLPARGPDAGERYPVLLVLDGLEYTSAVPTPVILDNLIHEGRIDPMIGVFVPSTPGRRAEELGASEAFARFVGEDLLPTLSARYPLDTTSPRNTVAGSSFGGLAAAFLAFRHPVHFKGVISQSGSFWWSPEGEEPGWMIREYERETGLGTRFYLEVGSLETGPTRVGEDSMISWSRRMRDALNGVGYSTVYAEYSGGHDYASWRETLGNALISVQRTE